MTSSSLSSLILRFLALGLGIYGLTLLVRGMVMQSQLDQMEEGFKAFRGLSASTPADDSDGLGGIGSSVGSMIRILYMASAGCLVVSMGLYAASRKAGALIARGLD
jgi:hypothetical protein